jgi:hypothetical protein
MTKLEDIRNEFYNALPTQDNLVKDVWYWVKITKEHIGKLDKLIDEEKKK